MEQKNKLGVVFAVFIAIVIGIALLRVVADSSYEAVNVQNHHNETVNVILCRDPANNTDLNETRYVKMDLINPKVISIDQVRWSNGTILTVNTDYKVTGYSTTGVENITIALMNTTKVYRHINGISNTTLVDYTYQPATYIDNSTGRTLIGGLVGLFFVIAILLTVIGIFGKEQVFDFLGV